jgi:hypothetical protein
MEKKIDKKEKRLGIERRRFSYTYLIPERRNKNRNDRRKNREQIKKKEETLKNCIISYGYV